ncbi:MAG: prephenate dehydratase [Acidobacteria bacterium]|nr:prephenate dehydratase [Acidobacteriota bacterium]
MNVAATTIGYLGPSGTFTEQALDNEADISALERVQFPTMPAVIHAVSAGEIDLGFVAIENSIEGSVNASQDTLVFDSELLIQREVLLSIQMNLIAGPGTRLQDITEVISIPHAIGQCRNYLSATLPDVMTLSASSTAEAVELLALEPVSHRAAIGPANAATSYGLEIIAADIEDHPENMTRFVVVAPDRVPAPTGHDRTSIVVFQRKDQPGSLLGILQEFAARSINLTKLESRPTRRSLGDYCFLIDLEGHISEPVVADALTNLHAKHESLKLLGSYPAAGEAAKTARRSQSDSWRKATAWLEEHLSNVD